MPVLCSILWSQLCQTRRGQVSPAASLCGHRTYGMLLGRLEGGRPQLFYQRHELGIQLTAFLAWPALKGGGHT